MTPLFFSAVRKRPRCYDFPVACESLTDAVKVCPEEERETVSVTVSPGFFDAMAEVMVFRLVTLLLSILVMTSPFWIPAAET